MAEDRKVGSRGVLGLENRLRETQFPFCKAECGRLELRGKGFLKYPHLFGVSRTNLLMSVPMPRPGAEVSKTKSWVR